MKYAISLAILAVAFQVTGSLFEHESAPVRAAAADTAASWTFPIEPDRVFTRHPNTDAMFAFLFTVTADGRPALNETMRLPGTPPRFRPRPDYGRVYRYRILDAGGRTIAEGLHFDRLARYTVREEGGCDKSLLGEHAMLLRVPAVEGAARLALEIVSERTDREEG